MGKEHKSFEEIIETMFKIFSENRLSLDEISKTYNVDVQFIKVLLNEDKLIISNISKLLNASNIKLSARQYSFSPYIHKDRKDYIKITRRIKPFCSIIFDKKTKEFRDLKPKNSSEKIGHNKKYLLLADFIDYKERFIDKLY